MGIFVVPSILVDNAKREELETYFFDEHDEVVSSVWRNHLVREDLIASICSDFCDKIALNLELVIEVSVIPVWCDDHLLSENGLFVGWVNMPDRKHLMAWSLCKNSIRLFHLFLEGLDISGQSFDSLIDLHDPVSSSRDYTVFLLTFLGLRIDFSIRITRVLLSVSRFFLL